jgi:hypothetical protein
MLQEQGHETLGLLPELCDLNATEFIWDIVITEVTCNKAVKVKVILKITWRTTSKPYTEIRKSAF